MTLYPLAGAAIALAGGDKLVGNRDYAALFRHLDWSEQEMQAAATAELAGGLLMMPRGTRRIGGAIVAVVSALILSSELSRGDNKMAASRAAVLGTGLLALFVPGGRND